MTDELYNLSGYTPIDRAVEYIEGAFSYSPHTVTTILGSTVNAPQEKVFESFEATFPCDKSFTVTYDHLGDWWYDYVRCELGVSNDCTLLLTSYDSEAGVCTKNEYSVSEGGQHVADLPSPFEIWGCTRPFDSMQTALHEVGHALMGLGDDAEGSEEHDVGGRYNHNGTISRTPMGVLGSYNECSDYAPEHDNCGEMQYWECCEDRMTHT